MFSQNNLRHFYSAVDFQLRYLKRLSRFMSAHVDRSRYCLKIAADEFWKTARGSLGNKNIAVYTTVIKSWTVYSTCDYNKVCFVLAVKHYKQRLTLDSKNI